jgi:DUF4097 and DUF4098 domain-containing protein YvlB
MNQLKFALLCPLLGLFALTASAQMRNNTEKTLSCNDGGHSSDRLAHYCSMQEQMLAPGRGAVNIDPGVNGGVTVKGWTQSQVLVRARIDAYAPSDSEARALVSQIRFASGGTGAIRGEGPAGDDGHHWSIAYEVFVPQQSDVEAHAHNGGIKVQDVRGTMHLETTNGGLHLARVAGDVSGRSVNGGLEIELTGDHWDGRGMNVETTNGGVHLKIPDNYSAHFEAETVNGGVKADFPMILHGNLTNAAKQLSFQTGSGGVTLRAVTTNGGVTLSRLSM